MNSSDYVCLITSINDMRDVIQELTEELNYIQSKLTQLYEKEIENK